MAFLDRIGIDIGRKIGLEEGIELAARHGVRFIDVQLDAGENGMERFDDARARAVREACQRHGVTLGLHTSSAVNVAEYAPVFWPIRSRAATPSGMELCVNPLHNVNTRSLRGASGVFRGWTGIAASTLARSSGDCAWPAQARNSVHSAVTTITRIPRTPSPLRIQFPGASH